ncbi:MAG: hypothetical protein RDV48_28055 [Candidatus Eremiobacteraeota bacterium]|nr:hypothetical protein [Candidatus Eremiobacteraeota bacterium]
MTARIIIAAALLFVLAAPVHGSNVVVGVVNLQANSISELSVSGSPAPLTVNSAVAGEEPTAVSDSTTRYSFTTNGTNLKITVRIDSNTETGTALMIAFKKPDSTWTSDLLLTSSTVDAVTGLTKIKGKNLDLRYTFSATVDAGEIDTTTRTVFFTLTN